MFGHKGHFGGPHRGGCHHGGAARHHHHHGEEPWGGPPHGRRWGPPGGRRFGRGDMKYVILDLLNDGPRHGYDVIRALEERFGGMYSPSPGSVYPTLQLLEDQGYVSGSELDGKRVYTITDAGRAFLQDRSSVVDDIRAKMHAGWGAFAGPEMRDLVGEVRGLGQFLMSQLAAGGLKDPEKLRKLRETIAKTRSEIEGIFRDNGTPPETL